MDEEPPKRRQIPTLLWGLLGLVVVAIFALLMAVVRPGAQAIDPTRPDVVADERPEPAPPPDAEPLTSTK